MPTSINGWVVLPPENPKIKRFKVPGTKRYITLRDDIGPLLIALAADYHKTIAPIDVGTFDDWGYAYREARSASLWSDHASGTAEDLNATQEGKQGPSAYGWWSKQGRYLKAKNLKSKYALVIWGGPEQLGGDYSKPQNWDPMHWALAPGTKLYQVLRQINKLGIKPDGSLWGKRPVVSANNIAKNRSNTQGIIVKTALNKEFPKIPISLKTGAFGSGAQAAWLAWEKRIGRKNPNKVPDYDGLIQLGNKYGFRVVP
jgi:hypothetical protein